MYSVLFLWLGTSWIWGIAVNEKKWSLPDSCCRGWVQSSLWFLSSPCLSPATSLCPGRCQDKERCGLLFNKPSIWHAPGSNKWEVTLYWGEEKEHFFLVFFFFFFFVCLFLNRLPLSMEFSRQQYWNGLPFPPSGDLSNPGIEPQPPALQADSLPSEPPDKPKLIFIGV